MVIFHSFWYVYQSLVLFSWSKSWGPVAKSTMILRWQWRWFLVLWNSFSLGKPWENHWNMGMSWGLTLLYLVGGLEHFLFSICWECDNPNWRTHIFQRGWNQQPVTNGILMGGILRLWCLGLIVISIYGTWWQFHINWWSLLQYYYLVGGLEPWNFIAFHSVGNVIPTDELHHFSEG